MNDQEVILYDVLTLMQVSSACISLIAECIASFINIIGRYVDCCFMPTVRFGIVVTGVFVVVVAVVVGADAAVVAVVVIIIVDDDEMWLLL